MPLKVTVTGGAGFLGSHLAEGLWKAGHIVTVLDNLQAGEIRNLSPLLPSSSLTFVEGDVLDHGLVTNLTEASDVIVHLAATVGVQRVLADPQMTATENVLGTLNVLRAASMHHRRVILCSTSEAYGKNPKAPLSESDDCVLGPPFRTRWTYAASKILAESITHDYVHRFGLDAIIVRPFNVVGPRQSGRYGMVLPAFIQQAMANRPITVYGNGAQRRCFLSVHDATIALAALVDSAGLGGLTFNLGNTEETSIYNLAVLVRTLANSSSSIVRVPYSEAYPHGFEEIMRRVPDISRLRKHIGFRPAWSLSGIVREMIDVHQNI